LQNKARDGDQGVVKTSMEAGGCGGERQKVGELLGLMKAGPEGSMVLGMELSELKCKGYEDFEIIR
jgi:hypothetical protein